MSSREFSKSASSTWRSAFKHLCVMTSAGTVISFVACSSFNAPDANGGYLVLCNCYCRDSGGILRGPTPVETCSPDLSGLGTCQSKCVEAAPPCAQNETVYVEVDSIAMPNQTCGNPGENSTVTAGRSYPLSGGTASGSASISFDGVTASAPVLSASGSVQIDPGGVVHVRSLIVPIGTFDFGGGETVTDLVVDAIEWSGPIAGTTFTLAGGEATSIDLTGQHDGARVSAHMASSAAVSGTFDSSTGALALSLSFAGDGGALTLSVSATPGALPPRAVAVPPSQYVIATCTGSDESTCMGHVLLSSASSPTTLPSGGGFIARTKWTRLSPPPAPESVLSNGPSVDVALAQGIYQIGLTVVNDHGLSDSTTANVTVANPPLKCIGFTSCEGALSVECPQSLPPDEPGGFFIERLDSTGWVLVGQANYLVTDSYLPASVGASVSYRACADRARTNCAAFSAIWTGPSPFATPSGICSPTGFLHCRAPLVASCCPTNSTNCACVHKGMLPPDCVPAAP